MQAHYPPRASVLAGQQDVVKLRVVACLGDRISRARWMYLFRCPKFAEPDWSAQRTG